MKTITFCKNQNKKPPYMNSQNQSKAQNYNQNVPQKASHKVFLTISRELQWIVEKIFHFFSKTKT